MEDATGERQADGQGAQVMGKSVTIQTLDRNFAEAIKESYDWVCAYMGEDDSGCPYCRNYCQRHSRELECAHYYNRYRASGRWHPDNCAALCHGAHSFLEHQRGLEDRFFRRLLGETRHDWLIERHQKIYRYKPHDRWEMNKHYIDDRKRIELLRANGETGYIRLVPYD